MVALLIGIVSGILTAGAAVAQSTAPSTPAPSPQASSPQRSGVPAQSGNAAAPGSAGIRLAAGSVIPASLNKTVDAKKAKTGDPVTANVTADLKDNGGAIILAKGTKLTGRVTTVQARTKEEKESQLGLAFDHAVMRDGSEMQLPMSIQAVIGPENNGPQDQNNGGAPAQPPAGGGSSPTPGRGMGPASSGAQPSAGGMNQTPDAGSSGSSSPRPAITAQTEGVIGISNLKLNSMPPGAQGSLFSSEKNNVKLESGTMMLLRVN
jgi:hypothetical protein